MNTANFPGMNGLRVDTGLSSFNKLFSFIVDTPDRIKESGKKVVAKSPLTPSELILAAGALPYDIITHENLVQSIFENRIQLTHEAVEAGISPELNPWQLIMLGSELNNHGIVPIDMYLSLVGGFDDQLTKSFQIIARAKSLPLRFVEIPRCDSSNESWALAYLEKELYQFIEWLELRTGNKVTDDRINEATRDTNQVRQDLYALDALLAQPRVPLGALEYYLLQFLIGDFGQDSKKLHELLTALNKELQVRVDSGFSAPGVAGSPIRVFVTGDMTQELSLFRSIENYGGCLVGCDFMLPLYYELIPDNASPLESFARWLWRMPVNLPVVKKTKGELAAIKKQKPDAIIIFSSVGSRANPGAERLTRDTLKEELDMPVLSIETTLPGENAEKVDYQVRAFLEMMR